MTPINTKPKGDEPTKLVIKLREQFLKFHAKTHRHVKNRDKALVYLNGWRNRFYLTPTKSTILTKPPRYEPAPDTDWQFILYNTAILTIHPDDTATVNLRGWYSETSFRHLNFLLTTYGPHMYHVQYYKPNKWTTRMYHLHFDNQQTPLFDGLHLNLATGRIINPQSIKKIAVKNCPEVREIRSQLMRVKEMYNQLANLHTISWNDSKGENNPFAGVTPAPKTYAELVLEKEPNPETYVWLVGANKYHYYRWRYYNYKPMCELNRRLQEIKDKLYRDYLEEV